MVEFYSHDYLFTWLHVFFSDGVPWRNYLINRVELFEEKSILVFPECLEVVSEACRQTLENAARTIET